MAIFDVDAGVIDCTGKYAVPGLFDSHTMQNQQDDHQIAAGIAISGPAMYGTILSPLRHNTHRQK